MKRSVGVTFAAVVALVGSGITFLFGIGMLAIMMTGRIPAPEQGSASPTFMKVFFVLASLVYIAPAAWGVVTGIGLLRLRNWARISMIVFAALLVFMSTSAGVGTLLMPLPATPGSETNPAATLVFRIFMGLFWLSFVGIGVWWLVFFTRPKVKMQFVPAAGSALPGAPPPPPIPGAATIAAAVDAKRTRPLSISIIAWLMLVGCLFLPVSILMKFPLVLFTKLATGGVATVGYLLLGAVYIVTGIGLLRLRPWARQTAIGLSVFGFLNGLVFYFTPGGESRARALIENQNALFPWGKMLPNAPPPIHLDTGPFLYFFAALGLIGAMVPAYFLVTRRAAFESEMKS